MLVVLTWADFGVRVFLPALDAPHWPNPAYWVAARLAAEGNADLIYADRQVFFEQSARLGTVPDIFEANMPTTILVFLPLQGFSETTAYIIWDVLMILCYILACALLLRALSVPLTAALAIWALVPLFHPWRENISRGQAYPLLLLLLIVGAIVGFQQESAVPPSGKSALGSQGSQWVAGLAFGLIAVVKLYYAAIFLLEALFLRRGRLLAGAIGLFALAAAVTMVLWGVGFWAAPLQFALNWRDRPETAVTAYQTLNSLLTHLFRYDPTWNRGPVADVPQLIAWLWWPLVLAILAATCLILWVSSRHLDATPRSVRAMLPVALTVPVGLILAPVAEDYHFVLTLFPLVLVGKVLWDMSTTVRERSSTANWLKVHRSYLVLVGLFAFSGILLGAPWRFNVPNVEGWHALLHYPRLYGSLLLWVVIAALIVVGPRSPGLVSSGTSAQ
ncbi:MAG TPA: glycosyltransferase family 87 protein [Chloroflexia bacterium]|nr:glycosyltransferase family 87 protein [Chloroflexia bacterium]